MEQELLPGCSREVFERVWKRVMPESREDCPFEVALPEERPLPAVMDAAVPAMAGEVETGEEEITCLGPASAVHGPQLQQYIDQELAAHRCCQALARRVPGSGGRMLSALAAEKRRRAKRLSTAYFLISGVRYWPMDRGGTPALQPVQAALREQFQAQQRGAACYRAAAAGTADPCLEALFHESAEEAEAHAQIIRGVLEQM